MYPKTRGKVFLSIQRRANSIFGPGRADVHCDIPLQWAPEESKDTSTNLVVAISYTVVRSCKEIDFDFYMNLTSFDVIPNQSWILHLLPPNQFQISLLIFFNFPPNLFQFLPYLSQSCCKSIEICSKSILNVTPDPKWFLKYSIL